MNFEAKPLTSDFEHSPETLFTSEVVQFQDDVLTELIGSMVGGDDIESYPQKWLDTYGKSFNEAFIELLNADPGIQEELTDEGKRNELLEYFKKEISQKISK